MTARKVEKEQGIYQLEGKKIGHVTVLRDMGSKNKSKIYLVRCECGCIQQVYGKKLVVNESAKSSFTCKKCKEDKTRIEKIRFLKEIRSKAFSSWLYMVDKCYPKTGYIRRTIDEKWFDFFEFFNDMKEPKDNECLMLKGLVGEYNKRNCVWADQSFFISNVNRM